jgi:hypothetical protein
VGQVAVATRPPAPPGSCPQICVPRALIHLGRSSLGQLVAFLGRPPDTVAPPRASEEDQLTVTAPARNEARSDAAHTPMPKGSPSNPRTVRLSLVAAALFVGAVAGCNDSPRTNASPIVNSGTTARPTPSTTGEQAAILSQYRLFWSSLTPVSRMPAAARRGELAKFTVDPELKSLLAGMLRTDQKGEAFYGAHIPRATSASPSADGLTAVVNDCQDSTKTGLARRSDLAPLTKGVLRNHVLVTMKKSAGIWKVAFVSYSQTPC